MERYDAWRTTSLCLLERGGPLTYGVGERIWDVQLPRQEVRLGGISEDCGGLQAAKDGSHIHIVGSAERRGNPAVILRLFRKRP